MTKHLTAYSHTHTHKVEYPSSNTQSNAQYT